MAGAQVVSTRCSQTYYQDSSLMTYFGLPLYHLHKDPSIVIQVCVADYQLLPVGIWISSAIILFVSCRDDVFEVL